MFATQFYYFFSVKGTQVLSPWISESGVPVVFPQQCSTMTVCQISGKVRTSFHSRKSVRIKSSLIVCNHIETCFYRCMHGCLIRSLLLNQMVSGSIPLAESHSSKCLLLYLQTDQNLCMHIYRDDCCVLRSLLCNYMALRYLPLHSCLVICLLPYSSF